MVDIFASSGLLVRTSKHFPRKALLHIPQDSSKIEVWGKFEPAIALWLEEE